MCAFTSPCELVGVRACELMAECVRLHVRCVRVIFCVCVCARAHECVFVCVRKVILLFQTVFQFFKFFLLFLLAVVVAAVVGGVHYFCHDRYPVCYTNVTRIS